MALTVNHPTLKEQTVYAHLPDLSTSSSCFVRAPFRGRIVKMGSVISAVITTANATVTTKINGTAITGGGWTVAFSGAAAGDLDTVEPTGANKVAEDDVIEFASNGGSSVACPTTFFAVIRSE